MTLECYPLVPTNTPTLSLVVTLMSTLRLKLVSHKKEKGKEG